MGCGASSKEKKYEDKKTDQPAAKTETTPDPAPAQKSAEETPAPQAAPPAANAEAKAEAAPPAAPAEAKAEPAPAPAAEAAPAGETEERKGSKAGEEEEEEDDNEDAIDDDEFERRMLAQQNKGARQGVMAENQMPDADWKPPVIPKTPEQRANIEAAVSRPQAFMFHGLEPSDLETVIMAFMEHKLEAGDVVIKQDENVAADVPGLFVIDSGELDVFKITHPEEEAPGKHVFTYQGQGQFGELALLYSAPRAATVIAKTQSIVWSIDRNTFNVCVKQAAVRRGEKYEQFLSSVDLLSGLDASDRCKIADVLKQKTFKEGDNIITQGEMGDEMYFLEAGSAVAKKDGSVVKEYQPSAYFGELALIRQSERAVDVVATSTPTTVACIDRSSFIRLLGPLENTMKERAKEYVGLEGGL